MLSPSWGSFLLWPKKKKKKRVFICQLKSNHLPELHKLASNIFSMHWDFVLVVYYSSRSSSLLHRVSAQVQLPCRALVLVSLQITRNAVIPFAEWVQFTRTLTPSILISSKHCTHFLLLTALFSFCPLSRRSLIAAEHCIVCNGCIGKWKAC